MPRHIPFRALVSAAVLASVLTVAGCGGDDGPTGPPPGFTLAGTWQWRIDNAVSGNVTCNVANVTLTFTGDNASPSGQFVAGGGNNITCTTGGVPGSPANFSVSGPLTNLSFSGAAISFAFPVSGGAWPMSGTITGTNAMGGEGTIRLTGSGQTLMLTGTWSATRN